MILTISNLGLQVIGFVYRMMLTRLAGTEAMGLNSLVMQIYSLAVSVCISGMNVAVVTLVGRLSSANSGSINRLVKAAFRMYIVLFLFISVPVAIFRGGIAVRLIGDGGAANAILLVLICIFLTGIENLLKSVHIGTGRAGTTAASELIEQGARLILVFLLLKNFGAGSDTSSVILILLGMVFSEFFSIGTLLWSYSRKYSLDSKKDMSIDEHILIRSYLAILIPATLTGIASTAFESISTLLLPSRLILAGYSRDAALSAIGLINGVAMPLVTMPMCFVLASNNIRLPEIAAAASAHDEQRLKLLIRKSLYAAAIAAFLVSLPLLPLLTKLSNIFFGIAPTQKVINLLSLKTAIIYFQITAVMILNALMKQGDVLAFALIGEFAQLLLIYVLSANPFLHIYGYIMAMIMGEGLRLVLNLFSIRKHGSHSMEKGASINPPPKAVKAKLFIRKVLPFHPATH